MAAKRKKDSKPTVDPELERQLASASAEAPVEAVFTLRTPVGELYRSADQTRAAVNKIVSEAASAAKALPDRVKVFPNVQSFAVSAAPSLVRSLLEHQDIGAAMANTQPEDILIRPVRARNSKKKQGPARRPRK
jgi:hypothetical protein